MVVPLLPGPPGFRDRPVCGIATGPASGLQNGDPPLRADGIGMETAARGSRGLVSSSEPILPADRRMD